MKFMKKIIGFVMLSFSLIFSSCQKNLSPIDTEPVSQSDIDQNLGEKLENPYSLKNMKRASQLLMQLDPTSSLTNPSQILPTHLYVRFLPDNINELQVLESDSTLVYDPVPFGHENSLVLDYYHDPAIPADKITWLYAFVPVDYTFPNVRHEVIEELYRPDDDDDELEVLALKLTVNLKDEVINGKEMMASELSDKEILAIFSKRYNPKGTIQVENSFGGSVPLRNAAIYIKTLWWNDVAQTNNVGYYYVDRRYKDIPSVKLWNRNRTNYTTQRYTEHAGFWVSDKLGEGKEFNHTIRHDTGSKRDLWVKATINNAYVIYDNFAIANGLFRPNEVKTWVFQNKTYGGAPMLHNQSLTVYSSFYPSIAAGNSEKFGSLIAKTAIYALGPLMDEIISNTIKHNQMPDIIVGTSGAKTEKIYSTVFHELAHYSHKAKLSNSFWANVQYQAMFDKTTGRYGDGSPTYGKHTGVAEAWSNFIEYEMMKQNNLYDRADYDKGMTAYLYSPMRLPTLDKTGADFALWIPSGLFRDLMDNDGNLIQLRSGTSYSTVVKSGTDRVSGFTIKQIYDLLNEDVKSIGQLKSKIISQYSHKNTNNEITELFELYGY